MPHVLIGPGSIERRPDAFSSDYLFAHSFGPVQISDFTQGLYVRIWRARVDNATGTVYLCRNNQDNTGWEAEVVLFNFAGLPILEMDAAFDQQGRVFICAERATGAAGASEIWTYYFNGLVGNYVFEMKGPGRTPKALLDDTIDTTNADVLLFYMNDPVGMCYRYQRDRYNTEYTVVLAASLTPVDPNGGDQDAPVGPLLWEAADVYINDIDQLWFPIFNTIYSPTVPGRSIIATAKGMYRPVPATLIGGNPSSLYGYKQQEMPEMMFNVYFNPPVTGVEVTAVGANYDGASLTAYAAPDDYAHPIGTVVFPKTDGVDPEVRRGFFAPVIAMITLIPSATDRTRWKDFSVRLDAPAAAIPIPPGIPYPAARCYIEDLYKATDGRVHILYSLRDLVKGQYNLYHYETLLYPISGQDPGSMEARAAIAPGGTLRTVLIQQTLDPEGLMALAAIGPGGDLHEVVIQRTLFDIEGLAANAAIAAGGTLLSTLPITHTLYDVEGLAANAYIAPGGTLYVAVISHTLYDKEGLMATAAIAAGGTLV